MSNPFNVVERIKRSIREDQNGCWIWAKAKTELGGYGTIAVNGKKLLTHRLAYAVFVGDIPDGLLVCHKCNVKACCNPDHLYIADNRTNILHAYRDGLVRHCNSKKHGCPKCGAAFTFDKRGFRFCRPCRIKNNTMHRSEKRRKAREMAGMQAIDAARGGGR